MRSSYHGLLCWVVLLSCSASEQVLQQQPELVEDLGVGKVGAVRSPHARNTLRRTALQIDDTLPHHNNDEKETRDVVTLADAAAHTTTSGSDKKGQKQGSETATNPVERRDDAGASILGLEAVDASVQTVTEDGGPQADIHPGTVFVMTVVMAAAAGLGALPFFFVGSLSKEWAALANAVACGVMLACSFDLMHEGQPYGGGLVVLGILLGAVFISASQQWLEQFEDVKFQGLHGLNARKIMLMIGIMAAHAFGEGAGVGVSFCGSRGWAQGVLVTLAIGLHNIPEGLAVSTVLVARGISPRHALLWTFFTSMPQPLVALPSFLFVDTFRMLLPVALGFAAGCMVWMVFAELLPDALADASHAKVATVGTLSAAWLEGLRMMLAGLERGSGGLAIPDALNRSTLMSGLLLTLPAVLSGSLAGKISGLLVKDRSAALGLAAGILVWHGGAGLVNSLFAGPWDGFLAALAAAVGGAAAAVLVGRIPPLWPPSGKEKQGDTPTKEGSQAVTALEQNGYGGHRWRLEADHLPLLDPAAQGDLEAAGPKRVFAPYRGGPNLGPARALVAIGVTAVAAHGLSLGFQISISESLQRISADPVWLPVSLRALLPGAAVAALLHTCSGGSAPTLVAGAVAAVAPVTGFLERLHLESRDAANSQARLVGAAASGCALSAGLWMVFPAAKAMNWRRATKGLSKGLALGAAVQCVTTLLCRGTSYCIR